MGHYNVAFLTFTLKPTKKAIVEDFWATNSKKEGVTRLAC